MRIITTETNIRHQSTHRGASGQDTKFQACLNKNYSNFPISLDNSLVYAWLDHILILSSYWLGHSSKNTEPIRLTNLNTPAYYLDQSCNS
jgi:hypothetical protein